MVCLWIKVSSSCQRSAFSTGFLSERLQPFRFQPSSHSVHPFWTYLLSVMTLAQACSRRIAFNPPISAINSIRLLVVGCSDPLILS